MSESQPALSSVASASPPAVVTGVPANPCQETSSSGHRGSVSVTLSTPPDCSQSKTGTSGVPQNVSSGGDEAKDVPQGGGPCANTEGRTVGGKEPPNPKFCAGKYEGQSFRERERDRVYSDWSRDKQRHYRDRDRSPERHRYRRDYRDHHYHRSYRERSPHGHSHRDWDSERRRERTSQHSYRDRHHERPHHSHYHRCRDDWSRDRRGYDHEDEAHDHWKPKEERRDSLAVKDKSNGRDRDCAVSSLGLVPETATAAKDSPSRDRPSASGPIANGEDHRCKEKYTSPESHRSKKHKKSKKKKKSKDKDRQRDSW